MSFPKLQMPQWTGGYCRAVDEFDRTMQELLGGQAEIVEMFEDIALETTFDGATVDAMAAAIRAEDPTAIPVPYLMSGSAA